MAGASALVAPSAFASVKDSSAIPDAGKNVSGSNLIVPHSNGLKITGTFLDEISHDIPHQNWGEKEWDMDFRYMKR